MSSIGVRQVPDERVLSLTRTVRVGQIDDHIDAAAEQLAAWATGVGPLFVLYHGEVTTEVACPVEVCLPIGDGEPADDSGAVVRVVPAHSEVFRPVTKTELDHPEILEVYAELDNYLHDNGWTSSGVVREIYLRDFAEATVGEVVCQVAFGFTS